MARSFDSHDDPDLPPDAQRIPFEILSRGRLGGEKSTGRLALERPIEWPV
jgi:hypothetical protein